jgi:pSer/pThr/pTyr-binding forkhead associated (FHA) protein
VHARVFDRDGDLYLEDLGSTNGTFVNGDAVQEATRLQRGDRVQIGHTELEVAR